MELLFSCLALFLISIGAGRLLGKLIDQKSIANIKNANIDNSKKGSVFLKKYKEVSIDRWRTTIKLAGLSISLGFLLLGAETYKKRKIIEVPEKAVVPYVDTVSDWVDPKINIIEPTPPIEVPKPDPPQIEIPIEPEVKEVKKEVIKKPVINNIPEPIKLPIPKSNVPTIVKATVNPTPKIEKEKPNVAPPVIPEKKDDSPKIFVEQMPEFEGGLNQLRNQIAKNYKIPKSLRKKGKVVTRFVVLEDGSIGDIEILAPIENCDACSEAAIKAIRKVKGKFSPGYQGNQAVKVWFTLPISIEIR